MSIQVKDFMSAPVTVVEGTLTVGEIRTLMQQKGIHAVPIVYKADDEIVIRGIFTTSDLCCKIDDSIPVEDAVKFSRVYVLLPTTGAKSAAEMMRKHKIHHIVVMDNGNIVGMISSLDFVKLVATHSLCEGDEKVH